MTSGAVQRPRILTAAFVKTIKEPGRYGDGRGGYGLYLRVWKMANGRIGRTWGQQVRINGKITTLGLGAYPLVTLALARERVIANAELIAQGDDPRIPVDIIPTFSEALDRVIAIHSEGWRHPKTVKRWRATLDTYALPVLETTLVSEVTTADVMACLTPIWLPKPETGRKVRERIGVVMKWAIAEGYRSDNPAGEAITKGLPKQGQRTQHFKALPFAQVGKAIDKVKSTDAWPATKLLFEFLALTAARSGEARLATWDEIDLNSATWTIPAARMKNGLEHRVPLSGAARDVLCKAQEWSNIDRLIFPSPRGKAMTDSTLSKLLRENDIGCVPHGLRSSFRDWAAECSDVPREIAEHALAHTVGSASELAYRRTDYFERRRVLMEQWGEYLSSP